MDKSLICIGCPRGCRLKITINGEEITVTGNSCPRGATYAKQEMTNPRRVVTAVIHTTSQVLPWLPVKTNAPLPKGNIAPLLNRLYGMTITPPIRCGDVIIEDIDGTGVGLVATESCNE